MRKFLVAFLMAFGIFGMARADCASNEFAYTDPDTGTTECITSKFQVTTIDNIDDYGGDFSYRISAAGTFYVDWGDGTVEKIERAEADYGNGYSHTYQDNGIYNIRFGGLATGYNDDSQTAAIGFDSNPLIASVSGSLSAIFPVINGVSPSFFYAFSWCENLTTVAGNMFSGLGTTPHMFEYTFAGTGITSIPSDLFAGVVGPSQTALFAGTFADCYGLTGAIPTGLFSGITGAPSESMFASTFSGAQNMSCDIPANLFSGITGAVGGTDASGNTNGSYTWSSTFYDFCSNGPNANSSISVPLTLFSNITGSSQDFYDLYTFGEIFDGSGLATSCPTGYYTYLDDYSQFFGGHVQCTDSPQSYTFTVTLDDDGGSGGSGVIYERYGVDWSLTPDGVAVTSVAVPTRSGHVFLGYYTSANFGTQIIGSDGVLPGNTSFMNNQTLYAQWAPVYTITLDDNGGSGGMGTIYEIYGIKWTDVNNQTITSVTIPTHPDNLTFDGYWTAENGGVQVIRANGRFAYNNSYFNGNQTLYARWLGQQYTITLDDNGGSGGMGTIYEIYGIKWTDANNQTITSVTIPTHPDNLTFDGYWAAENGGVQVIRANGSFAYNNSYFTGNQTLYARWLGQQHTITLDDNGGSGGVGAVYERYGIGWSLSVGGESITSINTFPTRPGYRFNGYWTQQTGGTKVIDTNGVLPSTNYFYGNQTLYAQWIEYVFWVTTTPLTANTTFSFYIAAAGTFYVDWGDGYVQTITRNIPGFTGGHYSHTYANAGTYNIRFGGGATRYSGGINVAIEFSDNQYVSEAHGSVARLMPTINGKDPSFYHLFAHCRNLRHIDETLFDGLSESGEFGVDMFSDTFFGCTGLTGPIPENLFSGIRGAPTRSMFDGTFSGCTGLTGSIPENLFSGIRGAPTEELFEGTFSGCTGLTGSIPENLFSGISGAPASLMFGNTFSGCTGLTGSIPGNLFSGVSGAPAYGMFSNTFSGCTGLTGPIPGNLFSGVSGAPAPNMFYRTFADDTGLTGSIPGNLFSGVSGAPESQMFCKTFANDTGLTGSIPGNLFSGISGAPSSGMFLGTFEGCSGLTGSIPGNLFSGISGAPSGAMYSSTFAGCTGLSGTIPNKLFGDLRGELRVADVFYSTFKGDVGLTGFIPPTLFENLTWNPDPDQAFIHVTQDSYFYFDADKVDTFRGTSIYTQCPCGTHQYITGLEDLWYTPHVSCAVGVKVDANDVPVEYWYGGQCFAQCDAGITRLRTSVGLDFTLLKTRPTTPALNIKYNDKICYVPAVLGNGGTGSLNFAGADAVVYHLESATSTPPAGFTGQPETLNTN